MPPRDRPLSLALTPASSLPDERPLGRAIIWGGEPPPRITSDMAEGSGAPPDILEELLKRMGE
jgi:hypothetical protein